ncbi:MAG: hypothetical protein CM1200mP35_09670 [Chloroflexota bacterium]|nr:MAG: hypothetical protein CM1200mP35_09670 [Chloroflexota bacterium]
MMVETVRDLRQAGISPPIMVGGAALSNRFTRLRIGPDYDGLVTYAQDAMTGLALANTLRDSDEFQKLSSQIEAETDELLQAEQQRQTLQMRTQIPFLLPKSTMISQFRNLLIYGYMS